ncbi:hypothetical protein L6258_03730, partial [Candidatus Parcubacteria bacterium]|nr:hypothetical protein [Candidatus Parcubacteria bacterium]
FWYDRNSQEKNLELCFRIAELSFKEAWAKECSMLGMERDCNLPETTPNKAIIKATLDQKIDECYERHSKFKIFTFLN